MRLPAAISVLVSCALLATVDAGAATGRLLAVSYASPAAFRAATEGRARVVRVYPRIHVAQIRVARAGAAAAIRAGAGIRYVEPVHTRVEASEPGLFSSPVVGTPYEWQYAAAHVDAVPESVLRAASAVTIAVIDTGADLTAPDLAAKSPRTHNLRTGRPD